MKISTIEVSGFASALKALRLPCNKGEKSSIDKHFGIHIDKFSAYTYVEFSPDDMQLMQILIQRGDSHAKPLRGIIAYADITAPIDLWCEIETYRCGHERLFSSSTMNTEGKALKGKELRKVLNEVSFGREIRKIDFFSYQCLRNIVRQRYNHRKEEWHVFIEWIKSLPMADELILTGLDKEINIHNELLIEMQNEGI